MFYNACFASIKTLENFCARTRPFSSFKPYFHCSVYSCSCSMFFKSVRLQLTKIRLHKCANVWANKRTRTHSAYQLRLSNVKFITVKALIYSNLLHNYYFVFRHNMWQHQQQQPLFSKFNDFPFSSPWFFSGSMLSLVFCLSWAVQPTFDKAVNSPNKKYIIESLLSFVDTRKLK